MNKVKKRDYLLIPTFNDVISKLLDKRYFTVLDIKKGFCHIKLDSKSADLCTFSSPVGYFNFLRLPFGISCAPETFIKKSLDCFAGISDQNIVNYFDDYCIATKTKDEHKNILETLESIGSKIRRERCGEGEVIKLSNGRHVKSSNMCEC